MSEELNLRQAAERLIYWCNRIEHASLEAEINECCAERDKILALFRKADADRASPTPEGRGGERGLTLRQAAERLLELGSKIDRASSEDEENRLCDERDRILSMMRKADALLSSPRVEDVRREALEEAAKWIELVGRDWKADGQHEKRFAADYLAAGIRALSPPVG